MSLLNFRYESDGLFANSVGPVLEITTALLITFAAVLVLVRLAAAIGVAPATDLDILAIAYS
jgi:hypothetical protein